MSMPSIKEDQILCLVCGGNNFLCATCIMQKEEKRSTLHSASLQNSYNSAQDPNTYTIQISRPSLKSLILQSCKGSSGVKSDPNQAGIGKRFSQMIRTALIIGTLWSVSNSFYVPPRQGDTAMNLSIEGGVEDNHSSIRCLLSLDGVITPPLLGFHHYVKTATKHIPLSTSTADAVEVDVSEMDDHKTEGVGTGWGYSWGGFHNIHH